MDLLFRAPCHSDFQPRLPIHFILVVCLLSLLGHSACDDDHPQSNGMVERMHRRLKAALVERRSSSSWPSELPWVLLGLRSVSPKEFLNNLHRLMSLHSAAFGHGPSPPSGSVHLRPALWEVEYVFVGLDGARPSLTPLYDSSYRVVHRSNTYFRLAVGDREDSVSVSRLKPLLIVKTPYS